MPQQFKGTNGHYYLNALFFEKAEGDRQNMIYSLKDQDHLVGNVVYPSLRRLYVEMEDLTEYDFANKYLANWNHWKKLKDCDWFVPHYREWREELEVRMKAKSLSNITSIAEDPDHKDNLQASKFILQDGWKTKNKGGVGRTTKEKIKQEANSLFKEKSQIKDDLERLKS